MQSNDTGSFNPLTSTQQQETEIARLRSIIYRLVTTAKPTGIVEQLGKNCLVPIVVPWDIWQETCKIARGG